MSSGWIGVDLDGTMFRYDRWLGWNVFGEPIPLMIDRVRSWIRDDKDVRVVTARIGLPMHVCANGEPVYSQLKSQSCQVSGEKFSDYDMMVAVKQHLAAHGLPMLRVQCYKDSRMTEFWDDRATQVVPNTGMTIAEHAAELIIRCGECDCPRMSRDRILKLSSRKE